MTHPDAAQPVPTVSLAYTRSRLRDPRVSILDVLGPDTFASGHLPGAINVPLPELAARATGALPDRDREIIAYCGGPT